MGDYKHQRFRCLLSTSQVPVTVMYAAKVFGLDVVDYKRKELYTGEISLKLYIRKLHTKGGNYIEGFAVKKNTKALQIHFSCSQNAF